MKKQIIINANKDRSRIAIVEDGELVELYVENPDNVRTIGNIYLGHVEKVMPTLRAAFVDIGEKQDAFLHFSDLTDNFPQLLAMSGEDVPGLDEPMLALAPQKRIADDASEPDVEDVLEVEPAEEKETSRSRSTRSRRSRGRGGRGRSRSGGSEEEEEQEEDGEGKKPSRGVFVLDLTTKPTRPAPKPAAVKEAAPAASKEADETPAPDDEAPKKRAPRKSRAKKTEAVEAPETTETPIAETTTPTEEAPKKRAPRKSRAKTAEEAPATETEAPPAAEAEEAPKKRAPRKSRANKSAEAEASVAEMVAETPAPDATPEASADETTARPRRRPRGRATIDDATTPEPSRSSRASAEAPAASPAAETTAEASAPDGAEEDRPRSRRKSRTSKATATTPEAEAATPEPAVEPEARPRSRRATRSAEEVAEAPTPDAQPTPDVDIGDTPRRPRGTMTIDLTSSPTKAQDRAERPARAEVPARAEANDAAEADDDERPRSRRRTRGQQSRRDEATDTPQESQTTDTADTPDEAGDDDRPRSRRGRRTRSDQNDAGRQPSDRTETLDGDASESRSRSDDSKRSDSGRSDSSRSSSRNGDASRSDSGHGDAARQTKSGRDVGKRRVPIPSNEQLLRRGGNVIVKVTKEPISAKGSRVSTDISLAGRFLVLVPAADYVAVSKKIESARERKRLRTLAQSLKPDNCGVIVRTVAEGRDAKSLDTDLRLLIDKWRSIEAKLDGGKAKAPVLLYEDVNMVSSIIRDLFSEDFDRILVDDPKVFKNVQAYVRAVAPDMADKVEMHRGNTPVYRAAGLEKQVEEAFSRRVNMKGGGYLFIETTEAMHVVDVNSGRAGRGKSQKENLIAVNVEAAREVAKQLRLRDLGGIIVVDFIDLRLESDRRKVTNALLEGFAKDRAVTKLLPMSDFGLVQITRQRLRPSITAQPEGDEPDADPAERAARAGAGEIAPTSGRRGRDDDRPSGRDLDAGSADEADAELQEERASRRPDRTRDDRNDRTRDERSDRPRDDRGERSRRGRTHDTAPTDTAPDDREPASPEPATTPEATTARLRAWLDVYRKTVDARYRDRPVVIFVHPLFLAHLQRGLVSTLTRWRIGIRSVPWRIEADAEIDPLTFDVRDEKSTRSLLKKYTP